MTHDRWVILLLVVLAVQGFLGLLYLYEISNSIDAAAARRARREEEPWQRQERRHGMGLPDDPW